MTKTEKLRTVVLPNAGWYKHELTGLSEITGLYATCSNKKKTNELTGNCVLIIVRLVFWTLELSVTQGSGTVSWYTLAHCSFNTFNSFNAFNTFNTFDSFNTCGRGRSGTLLAAEAKTKTRTRSMEVPLVVLDWWGSFRGVGQKGKVVGYTTSLSL